VPGVCTDLKSDRENCNYCGNKCNGNKQCVNGTCT
jgi:hypothetical protein